MIVEIPTTSQAAATPPPAAPVAQQTGHPQLPFQQPPQQQPAPVAAPAPQPAPQPAPAPQPKTQTAAKTPTKPQPAKPAAPVKDPAAPAPQEAPTQDVAAKEVAESVGLDYDALVGEVNQTGTMTQDTRGKVVEALKKAGLPEAVLDEYLANREARIELLTQKAYQLTDGPDGYQAMSEWAQTTLSPVEQKVFSDMAESGNPDQALMAIKLLYQQYRQTSMTGGSRVKATSGGAPEGGMFRNMAELAAAQREPGYGDSPTKQEEVRRRLERSIAAGVYKN